MTLTKAAKELLIRQPFYGFFLLNINKQFVDENHKIKTAAIAASNLSFTLYVNEKFWNSLTHNEQVSVLCHEVEMCSLLI